VNPDREDRAAAVPWKRAQQGNEPWKVEQESKQELNEQGKAYSE